MMSEASDAEERADNKGKGEQDQEHQEDDKGEEGQLNAYRLRGGCSLPPDHRLLNPNVAREEVIHDIERIVPRLSPNDPDISKFLKGFAKSKFHAYTMPTRERSPTAFQRLTRQQTSSETMQLTENLLSQTLRHGFGNTKPVTLSHV
jgi:hypothetical protein